MGEGSSLTRRRCRQDSRTTARGSFIINRASNLKPLHPTTHASSRHIRLIPHLYNTATDTFAIMDSLVAQYSRPAYTEEAPSEQEQLELYSGNPELSLKFALPPVAQVCYLIPLEVLYAKINSQHHGFAQ